MISSFRNRQTETLFKSGAARAVPRDIERRAFLLLRQLNAAARLQDMATPPGNRLEKLGGDRAGSYSVRVNQQWRIVFRWTDIGPADVELSKHYE